MDPSGRVYRERDQAVPLRDPDHHLGWAPRELGPSAAHRPAAEEATHLELVEGGGLAFDVSALEGLLMPPVHHPPVEVFEDWAGGEADGT